MENNKELLMRQPDGTEVEFEKAIVVNLQGKYDASVHFFNCEAEDFLSAAYAVLTILDKFGIKDEFLSRYDENSSNCKIYGGRYNGGDDIVRNEKGVFFEFKDADMTDRAVMCGALQQTIGLEAYKRGMSMDDVRDNMLELHLKAMEQLKEQADREESGNGS